jgi:hypothetical protein
MARVWAFNPAADPRLSKFCQFTTRSDPPPTRGVLLVLDEVDRLLPTSSRPLDGWTYDAIELGRHRNVSIIATARRPQTLHRSIRCYATRVYLGHLGNQLDVEQAAREWGPAAFKSTQLPPFKFIEIRP